MPKSTIKTKGKGSYRAFDGEIKVLQKQGEWLYGVEIWLLNDKTNRNKWRFTDMAGHKDLFKGTPILIAYVNNGTGIGDGHNYRMEIDPMQPQKELLAHSLTIRLISGWKKEMDIHGLSAREIFGVGTRKRLSRRLSVIRYRGEECQSASKHLSQKVTWKTIPR